MNLRIPAAHAQRRLAGLAASLALCAALPATAGDAPVQPKVGPVTPNKEVIAGGQCASVVIRNCRARFVPDPSARAPAPGKSDQVPGRWEAVRNWDPDSEEILVEATRPQNREVHEVFEQYLGLKPGPYDTAYKGAGSQCTTIVSTGARFCSSTGSQRPQTGPASPDFTDSTF